MTIVGHSSVYVTQEAITTLLTNSTSFTSICNGPLDLALHNPGYQTNQAMPYVAFGDHVERTWYQFQKPSKQVDFVMHIYSQSSSYQEAYNILDVIDSIIEAETLSLPGGTFTNAENGVMFISATKIPETDAVTRHVEGRWRIWNNAN